MKLKSIALFGLIMISLIFITAVAAALSAGSQGLVAVFPILGAALLFRPVRARVIAILLSQAGAAGVASDTIGHLRTLKYTHSAALTAGDILKVGAWVMQAMNTTLGNVENVFIYRGKMTWPKEAALAINARDMVYWDNANGVVTKTAVGNTPIGVCVESALAADSTVTFMLTNPGKALAPVEQKVRAEVALADAAATLTATQLINSGTFTITPTVARALTVDTAANIVAALEGGTSFDFSVACLAAFAVTITTAAGITLKGGMALNNQSGTFRAIVTNSAPGSEAVTIIRIA